MLSKGDDWGTIHSVDWVKCWDAPDMNLEITYSWHPILPKPAKGSYVGETLTVKHFKPKWPVKATTSSIDRFSKRSVSLTESTSSQEDKTPLLKTFSKQRADTTTCSIRPPGTVTFDPTVLEPDEIKVNFTLKPGSTLYLYGTLLDHIISLKV